VSIIALLALPETKGINLAELDARANVRYEVIDSPSRVGATGHL
jgi:hypothetical protein